MNADHPPLRDPSTGSGHDRHGDAPMPTAGERALVLGGGGAAGNAWLIGVIAGLFDAGLDVTRADTVIGTSAGSTAAAQLIGATPPDLLAAVLAEAPPRRTGSVSGGGPTVPPADHLERMTRIIATSADAADMRRRMGAAVLEADAASDGSAPARWRATVAERLPGRDWPDHALLITAVDARTGEPVVLDSRGGADLVDAVAASTAGGSFSYPVGDRRLIDGGYRSVENADLAAGHARVLVLSPLGGSSRHPREWGTRLAAQVDDLRARGSSVETILPDGGSRAAFGAGMMDPATRAPAARAGYDQGRAVAGRLTAFWS
jgi:NTE family protein